MLDRLREVNGHITETPVYITVVLVLIATIYILAEEKIDRVLFLESRVEAVLTVDDKYFYEKSKDSVVCVLCFEGNAENGIKVMVEDIQYSQYDIGDKVNIEKIIYRSRLTGRVIKVKGKLKEGAINSSSFNRLCSVQKCNLGCYMCKYPSHQMIMNIRNTDTLHQNNILS